MKIRTRFKIVIYTNILIILYFLVLRTVTINDFKYITTRYKAIYGFSQIMNKHYQFVDDVERQLYESDTILANTNPDTCYLTLWINSDIYKSLTNKNKQVQELTRQFDSLHRILHADIIKLNEYLADTTIGKWVAINYFQSHTKQVSAKMQMLAKQVQRKLLKQIDSQRKKLFAFNFTGFVILILALLLLMYMAYRAYVSITRSVRVFEDTAQKLAQGDLTARFELDTKDELNFIAGKINAALDKIQERLQSVLLFTKEVLASSQELATSAKTLTDSASNEAVSAEELSSLMDEMNAIVEQNSVKASKVQGVTAESSSALNSTKENIRKLTNQIRTIAQNIKVINKISSQIDILAVNASIEAARSGEFGKGFRVIAREIRKLADETQRAAEEIISKANQGVAQADQINKESVETFEKMQKVIEFINDISESFNEQANGIKSIADGIMQLTKTSQQNSSLSEELATTADYLSKKASSLQQQILRFKIQLTQKSSDNV